MAESRHDASPLPAQMQRNVAAGSWSLSEEDLAEVTRILGEAGEAAPAS